MLCLTAGALSAVVAASSFTLAWDHSIEKIRWEEDWRIEAGRLVLSEARIRGSGAGMEIPPDAVLRAGIWHFRPALPPLQLLRLTHSPYTAGYEQCIDGRCGSLVKLLPGLAPYSTIELGPCDDQQPQTGFKPSETTGDAR